MLNRFSFPRRTLRYFEGSILPRVEAASSPLGLKRIYLLVHGFNNDEKQAQTSYQLFRERIQDDLNEKLVDQVWEFYWPGFDDYCSEAIRQRWKMMSWANSINRALSYSRQVPKAINIGTQLGEYILNLNDQFTSTEVVLIGHSLGCRLILEALKKVSESDRKSDIVGIFLMAPAIPVAHLRPQGRLKTASQVARHSFCVHSTSDLVLRATFPPGQCMAGDPANEYFPEAVGLNGNPSESWTATYRTMLSHGDYWRDSSTNPRVLRLFGKFSLRPLPISVLTARALANSTELPHWEIPVRNL